MFIRTFRSGFRAFLLSVFSLVALVGLSTSCIVDDFDNVYNVTIKYYYNDKDSGSVKSREVNMVIPRGEMLAGSPLIWDDRWPNDATTSMQFGYIGDGKQGLDDTIYMYKSINGVWQFNEIAGRGAPAAEWDTSMPVSRSLVLEPRYIRDGGEEELSIYFKYNKPNVNFPKGYEEVTEKRTVALSKVNGAGVSLESLQSGELALELFSLEKSDDYGYGYMDASQHNRFYYFDELTSNTSTRPQTYREYICYDKDGNKLEGVHSTLNKMISADMDGYTYCPKYIPAGYKNIPASEDVDCGIFDVEQVFIPGNINQDGSLSPFPYSHAGEQAHSIYTSQNYRVDGLTTTSAVRDMYVMDTPMTTALLRKIFDTYPDLEEEYNWNNTSQIAAADKNKIFSVTSSGVTTEFKYVTYVSPIMCYNIANLLTEYYNRLHPNDEPLSLVYHIKHIAKSTTAPAHEPLSYDKYGYNKFNYLKSTSAYIMRLPYTAPVANQDYFSVYVDPDASGFRLPWFFELEYCGRIITDERLLPDPSNPLLPTYSSTISPEGFNPVIYPTEANGLKHHFMSFKGTYRGDDSNAPSYGASVSGAGLAVWRNGSYFPSENRTAAQACGRSGNGQAGIRDNVKNESTNTTIDYNRRNGAGLWGMAGCGYAVTMTYDDRYSYYNAAIGGPYTQGNFTGGFGSYNCYGWNGAYDNQHLRLIRYTI